MSDQIDSGTSADNAAALFEFLVQLVHLRTKSIRDVAQYANQHGDVLWLNDLPHQPEVKVALDASEPPDEWLAITRPRRHQPPELPHLLEPWVDRAAVLDPTTPLGIREVADVPVERRDEAGARIASTEARQRADMPEISTAWAAYLASWSKWAEEARRIAPVVDVYTRLFEMHQRAGQLGEQYEIVVGVGLLLARTSTGDVRRHLVTRRARIVFEEATGRIAVAPDEDAVEAAIETDMLDGELAVPGHVLATVRTELQELGSALLSRSAVAPVLSRWINSASPGGYVDEALAPPPLTGVTDTPRLVFSPAVILRPRSQRSLVSLYRALIDLLGSGVRPPELVRGLVEIVEPTIGGPDEKPASGEIPEVYFPLPANDEQLRIVERLRTHRGVVVVGPPGTGKSHTIANIVSDALAHGKRVVVTSHTGRALEVLVEKLPPDIRDLCVIMAGEGRGVTTELKKSVDAILQRSSDPGWTEESAAAAADRTRRALRKAEDERAVVLARRRSLRELETANHDLGFGGYTGTLARIAERLAAEDDRLGWIPDEITDEAPISDSEAGEWLDLELSPRRETAERARRRLPADGDVKDPSDLAELIEAWRDAAEDVQHPVDLESDPAWMPLASAPRDDRRRVRESLRSLRQAAERVDATFEWVSESRRDVLAGLDSPWRARFEAAARANELLAGQCPIADGVRVLGLNGLDERAIRRQSQDLRAHLARGGSLGFGPFRPASVKAASRWLKIISVDGGQPTTVATLDGLIAHLDCAIALSDLSTAWGDRIEFESSSFSVARGVILEIVERLGPVLELDSLRDAARQAVHAIDEVPEPMWSDLTSVRRLEIIAGAVDAVRRRDDAATALRAIEARLVATTVSQDSAPEVRDLAQAVADKDLNAYSRAHEQLEETRRLAGLLNRRDALFGRVAAAAPQFAGAVRDDPDASEWRDWLLNLGRAWDHGRASGRVRSQLDGGEAATLDQQLARLDDRIRLYIRQLGATLAWQTALRRLTQHHKAHLQAYRRFMAKVGKGTGKYAATNLALARKSMNECIDAVPAWIMPTYRLAETLTPRFEPFDLAIVDEASQSGVESLFVWALAKQVVVVGDDQQISPDAIGVSPAAVSALVGAHIPDIPLAHLFSPDVSIFDQALVRYPGRLQLREHFRCMPEIIAFSNRLSYASTPLEPVRQFGTDRLPPLRAAHVAGAEVINDVNRREADAVVDQVIACCHDPAYDGASMGVISLTGDRQAAYIQRRLIERLGPEMINEHRIKCGDASAFQGDQRRVIFLSMVAAPTADGHRLAALTAQNIQQRFNVAASRAEDQAWLFHSVTLSDLNPVCLRAQLLSHFLDPQGGVRDFVGDVSTTDRQDPFESLFEQRVCRRLLDRGYQIVPQHQVLNYRIDLVVEGGASKLAIECDGDAWHGAEEYEHDLGRQRDLERCGWRFVRIPESLFYLDPDEAMAPVWEALDRLGISPATQKPETRVHDALTLAGRPAGGVAVETDPKASATLVASEATPHPEETPAAPTAALPPPELIPQERVPELAPSGTVAFDGTLQLDAAAGEETAAAGSMLAPYRAWVPRSVPALTSPSPRVRDAINQIVDTEGPIVVRRLADLYARALGRELLNRTQRHVFNQAIFGLIQYRQLLSETRLGQDEMSTWTVRAPTSDPVVLRDRGPRALQEIPASEVMAAARLIEEMPGTADDIVDTLCDLYQVSNTIEQHRAIIAVALGRAKPPPRAAPTPPPALQLEVAAPQPFPRPAPLFADSASRHSADRLTREFEGEIEQAMNDALGLGLTGLKRLADAWDDSPDAEATRSAVFEHLAGLGVTLTESAVIGRVRAHMPNTMGAVRGAVIDTALARFAKRFVDADSVAALMKPWAIASSAPEAATRDAIQVCSHGNSWGQCHHPACPGRFLGGNWGETDWRNNW